MWVAQASLLAKRGFNMCSPHPADIQYSAEVSVSVWGMVNLINSRDPVLG